MDKKEKQNADLAEMLSSSNTEKRFAEIMAELFELEAKKTLKMQELLSLKIKIF